MNEIENLVFQGDTEGAIEALVNDSFCAKSLKRLNVNRETLLYLLKSAEALINIDFDNYLGAKSVINSAIMQLSEAELKNTNQSKS